MHHGEYIQLKQFAIDFHVDVVPFCALRTPCVVHQDVQGLEVVYHHVEVVIVMVHVQHVHLKNVYIVRAESAIGLRYWVYEQKYG